MTLIIDKANSKNISKLLDEKLKRKPKNGNLAKHFGKLKRNLDGLNFQIEVRKNEDWFYCRYNFLIYVHEENKIIFPFLNYNFGVSFISEVELLGFKGISKDEELKLKLLLNDCFSVEWNSKIKEKTIELKKKYTIKLPDAITASTSLIYELPLVSADKGFSKIEELDLILIEL